MTDDAPHRDEREREIARGAKGALDRLCAQGYRMFKSMSTRKLSSHAARLSLPRNEVFVSG